MSAVVIDIDAPWRQFICRACGFIYDEKDGDPDGGLVPGTRFEDIPEDWACPLCGVSKQDFDPYEVPASRSSPGRSASRSMDARRTAIPLPSRHRKGVVIVGGGLAGWSVARALRSRDSGIPITLVAADAADVYPKPALSLASGQGKHAEDLIASSGVATAAALAVRLVANAFASAIDAPRRRVRTTRGTFGYDRLVLALGARPLDLPALPPDLCWRINALDTWTKLDTVLQRGPARVAIVGAGLVGCELADDLAHAGHAVTLLDPAHRPLATWATAEESRRLLDGWRAFASAATNDRRGVAFIGGALIDRVVRASSSDGDGPIAIHRSDGVTHTADVVIAAIGLAIDRRLARTAGLVLDNGIAVDAATLITSDPSIHAAGGLRVDRRQALSIH